jgi:L-ascorbate metabolism protein UlaG (beta-lactamase superfamily)
MIRITWYGHAAFKLESPELSVILDPYRYPDAGGYLPIDDSADAVCISHINDRYHSHTGQIKPGFTLLEAQNFGPEGVLFQGVRFQSVPVYETPEKLAGDEVTVIYFTLDGLKIVFLSDLGHALTPEERAPLEDADLLFASTGGKPTIDLEELMTLIRQLQPKAVIPMHFKTEKINLKIFPNDVFLNLAKDLYPIRHAGSSTIELTDENLPSSTEIVVLDYLR